MPPKTQGPKRHRKILRDKVQGLKKGQFQRLSYKAGVKSLSGLCYEDLRGITKVLIENILRDAITMTQSRRGKTVSLNDVLSGIRSATGKKFAYTPANTKVKGCSI
jgi:histone H4